MRKKIIILVLILLIIIPLFYWINSLGIIANSDSQHGYNSFYSLKNELFSWKDSHNGGGYLPIPMLPPLILGSLFNFFGLTLSSAGVTVLLLAVLWFSLYQLIVLILKTKSPLNKFLIFVTSSFIVSNEIIKNYLISNNTVIWAELFTILTIYFYFKYYYEAKSRFLIFSLICLGFTLIMFHSFILTIFFIFLYGVGEFLLRRRNNNQNHNKFFRKFIIFLVLLLSLNAYFLFGNFLDFFNNNSSILASYGSNKSQTDQVLEFANDHYNNLDFNFILSRDAFFSKYPPYFKPIIIGDYFLILLLSLSAFFYLKNKGQDQEIKKRILIFFIIYIVMVLLAFGPKGPLGIFNFLWEHAPGFKLFRDFFKFHWIILILLPTFCVYSVISYLRLITNHKYYKQLKIIVIILVLLLFLIPLSSFGYLFKYFKPFNIPNSYFNLNYDLSEKKNSNSTMVMPIISWMQKYTWSNRDYDMQDPFSTNFIYKPVYVNAVMYDESFNDALNKKMVNLFVNNSDLYYKLASLRNIEYLIIRDDLSAPYIQDREKIIKTTEEYLDTKNLLNVANNSPYIKLLKKFDDLYLYELNKDIILSHFYIPQTIITIPQSIDALPEIVSQQDYQIRSAIYFDNQNKNNALIDGLANKQKEEKDNEEKARIFFEENDRKKELLLSENKTNKTIASIKEDWGEFTGGFCKKGADLPVLEFKKINPTKYKVVVHHAQGDFPLVFSESFHDGWKMYLADKKSQVINNSELANYKTLDGNIDDQANREEVNKFIDQGLISSLGDGKEKEIQHQKWENNKEQLDYIEKYNIDFISKNFQGTIQNDNLSDGKFYETWFQKPIDDENHLMVNGYANSWTIDTDKICQANIDKCTKNPDGSYDFELTVEFWPQRLFYIGLAVSGITLFGCIIYLVTIGIVDIRKKRKKHE